jgi:large subunit ribosomal protein L13
MKYTIDAQGKRIGRVASEVAVLLMGKNTTAFVKNKIPEVTVTLLNVSKARIDAKKMKTKIYANYTGHPGGLFHKNMQKVVDTKGYSEIFRDAIYGMLPHNKLTKEMMKNLVITE